MIEPLEWDSKLLGRKIGRFTGLPASGIELDELLATAKANEIRYVFCRIGHEQFDQVRMFEQAGFSLADLGVVWSRATANLMLDVDISRIGEPGTADIPALQRAMHRIWNDSRFYHDPFFSQEEADLVFAEWVKNSITGQAANATFSFGQVALVTCRKTGPAIGDIPLMGVHPSQQGKGWGRQLVARALRWFQENGCETVTVRTQLRNIPALNFYRSIGFTIGEADLTVSKIL